MGVSALAPPTQDGYGPKIDSRQVDDIRRRLGGQIQPLPTTKLKWYLEDLDRAQAEADAGHMRTIARLCRAMRRDGTIAGLLGARTAGVVRLPQRFYGDAQMGEELRSQNESRGIFNEMCPSSELALLGADGVQIGVGVGELVPVIGRDYPVLVRLDPEFLYYRWTENRWYFLGVGGVMPITPGDGRWVLHVPGGRLNPWMSGLWPSLGRAFINKEHAISMRANYCAKLANPARVAMTALGSTERERQGFFRRLMAWGVNTVLEMPPGWDAKLLESNGRGWEVFQRQIDTCDQEAMIALAGQIVTTTGGMGFGNAKYPDAIRRDLVQDTADGLAYTVNTQVLPAYAVNRYGADALSRAILLAWDTGSFQDLETQSRMMTGAAAAIKGLIEALGAAGKAPNIPEIMTRFRIPIVDGALSAPTTGAAADGEPSATIDVADSDDSGQSANRESSTATRSGADDDGDSDD